MVETAPFVVAPNAGDDDRLETIFEARGRDVGMIGNAIRAMARLPGPLEAILDFSRTVYEEATLDRELLYHTGIVASAAAQSDYCRAHWAYRAHREGFDLHKLRALPDFQGSDLFEERERLALTFAGRAATGPSTLRQPDYQAMAQHFSEVEITEILLAVCDAGFFNRWTSAVATPIEQEVGSFVDTQLGTDWLRAIPIAQPERIDSAIGPFLPPLRREDTPELEPTYQDLIGFLGFVPNTELTMARKPRSTKALIDFVMALYGEPNLPPDLMLMIGQLSSSAAGCQYCTSHNVIKAADAGFDADKIAAVWEFETSPLFDEREKAALNFAFKSVQVPNALEAGDYDMLREHFNETEITEMLFIVCQFGIFNRFNDAVGATVEASPLAFCKAHMSDEHWQAGKHDA